MEVNRKHATAIQYCSSQMGTRQKEFVEILLEKMSYVQLISRKFISFTQHTHTK